MPHTPRPTPTLRICLTLALLLSLLSSVAAPAQAQAIIWCVKPGGGPTAPPCGNGEAFGSFANALEVARPDDQIRLSSGVYTGTGQAVFDIDRPLRISGGYAGGNWQVPSANQPTIVDGQGARRGLLIRSVTVRLDHLIIQNGADASQLYGGGGIHVEGRWSPAGTLFLDHVILRNNRVEGSGGAVFIPGDLVMRNTSFISNSVTVDGGAFFAAHATLINGSMIGNQAGRDGGGSRSSTIILDNALIDGNIAETSDGGGVYVEESGIITNTTLVNNHANGFGAGIYQHDFDGNLGISDSIIRNNRAEYRGGGGGQQSGVGGGVMAFGELTIQRSQVEGNYAQSNGGGIAQVNDAARLTVRDVLIAGNTASEGSGGGMSFGGGGVFERVEVVGNLAGDSGGGLYQSGFESGRATNPITIRDSQIARNEARSGRGGGMMLVEGVALINSLVADNSAESDGGGIYQNNYLSSVPRAAVIQNSLIVGNTSRSGSGGGVLLSETATLSGSRFFGNRAGRDGGGITITNVQGLRLTSVLLADNQAAGSGEAIDVIRGEMDDGPLFFQLVNVTITSHEQQNGAAIRIAPPFPNIELINTLVTSHTVGIERPATSRLSGDYNAAFGLGAEQRIGAADATFPFTTTLRADPRFVDPASQNFHLRPDSPLVNQGDPARSYTNQRDIDQQRVPFGPRADIGADEQIVRPHRIWLPLVRLPGNY